MVAAVGALVLLIFGTGLLESIPSAVIGAVVAVAVMRLLGVRAIAALWGLSRFEFAIAVSCFVGVLLLGPLGGLFASFVLALLNLAWRAAHPPIETLSGEHDPQVSLLRAGDQDAQTAPGVVILRCAAPIFFANGATLTDRVKGAADAPGPPVRAVVLDLESVTDLDVTGSEALRGARKHLAERGVVFGYTRMRDDLRELLHRFDLIDGTVEFATNRAAVAELRAPGGPVTPDG